MMVRTMGRPYTRWSIAKINKILYKRSTTVFFFVNAVSNDDYTHDMDDDDVDDGTDAFFKRK